MTPTAGQSQSSDVATDLYANRINSNDCIAFGGATNPGFPDALKNNPEATADTVINVVRELNASCIVLDAERWSGEDVYPVGSLVTSPTKWS